MLEAVLVVGHHEYTEVPHEGGYRREITVEILKESEKAVQIKVSSESYIFEDPAKDKDFAKTTVAWLPKSQIEIRDNLIVVPTWLGKEKGILHGMRWLSNGELTTDYGLVRR